MLVNISYNKKNLSQKRVLNAQTALIIGLLSLSACASNKGGILPFAPKVEKPMAQIDEFRDSPMAEAANSVEWWQKFADEKLNQLVKDAQNESISIQLANARLKEARSQGLSTVAGFAPRLDANLSLSQTKATRGPDLVKADGTGTEETQSTSTQVLAASWELPLFGRLGNSLKGAKANVQNAKIGVEGAKIALIADLAAAYIDLRASQTRLSYLENDLEQAKILYASAKERLRVGLISQTDASYAQTTLAAIEGQIPDAKLMVQMGLNRVAILRGVDPGSLDEFLAFDKGFEFKYIAPNIVTIPADFVRRRLDVRQAEQTAILMAAGAGISRADLYPRVSISGTLSLLAAVSGVPLVDKIGRQNFNPAVSLPLFDFGQRRASIGLADAKFDQAFLNYKLVTLNALAEGQQALSNYSFAREKLLAAQNGEKAALTRYNAGKDAYKVGLYSMKDLVEVERDYAQARNQRLSAQASYSDAAIALYRAFAGSPEII